MKIKLDGRMIGVLVPIFMTEHRHLHNNPVDPIPLVFTTLMPALEGSKHNSTTPLTLHIITDILLLTTQLIIFHKYYKTIQRNCMVFVSIYILRIKKMEFGEKIEKAKAMFRQGRTRDLIWRQNQLRIGL